MMDRPTTKEVAQFFDKVNITKHCWLWTGYLGRCGYGRLWLKGKRGMQTHRFSYELFVGPIESEKLILHRRECGNRNCVNPNHLYMGTQFDNMRDRMLWGKSCTKVGESNGQSKLSEKDVLSIRRIHKNKGFGYAEIAELFGVSPLTIGDVVRRDHWKHI